MYLRNVQKVAVEEHAQRARLDIATNKREDVCYHVGNHGILGFDFKIRDELIVADVLDSPFPPCPEALDIIREQLERCCQESPLPNVKNSYSTIAGFVEFILSMSPFHPVRLH